MAEDGMSMTKSGACRVTLGVLLGFSVALADQKVDEYLSAAKEAYRHKDYAKALENYQQAAELGSADAYRGLANMYLIGAGVPKDSQKASAYFRKAMDIAHAQRENPQSGIKTQPQVQQPKVTETKNATAPAGAEAYMRLGENHANGQGVTLDFKKAIEAFEKAGEMGDARGYNAIGDLYYNNGKGVEQDYAKAFSYYQKAAKMGQAKDYRLGVMYYYGRGVDQDYNQALEHYEAAAKKGDGQAYHFLAFIYQNGKGAPLNYQKAREYYQQALKHYLEAGNKGDASAYVRLGNMYYEGDGVPQDYQKAMEYYQEASKLKSGDGEYRLATMLARGKVKGVSEDKEAINARYQKVIEFYKEKGKNGDANAYAMLGSIYKDGVYVYRWYVRQDYKQALEYYQKGAEMGNGASYYEIGRMYNNAQGVDYNWEKAQEHYKIACKMGFEEACGKVR